MSALDELLTKKDEETTDLEFAVVVLSDIRPQEAENAAAELERLRFENKANRQTWEAIAYRLSKLETDLATGAYHKNLDELARLRQIEQAAREVMKSYDLYSDTDPYAAIAKLAALLEDK